MISIHKKSLQISQKIVYSDFPKNTFSQNYKLLKFDELFK